MAPGRTTSPLANQERVGRSGSHRPSHEYGEERKQRMTTRLLLPSDLPDSLWEKNRGCLRISQSLCDGYSSVLCLHGLIETAKSNDNDDGPVGGIRDEDTKRHFATRFAASAARTQLALLDPRDHLENASDLFLQAFSGGHVSLLDIPCGGGAASADLLALVAALREHRLIPRQPLFVQLVAGDISPLARQYASEVIESIRPSLESQSVFVEAHYEDWNTEEAASTTSLLHSWMKWAHACREHFVVMANFSGFLQRQGKFDKARPQLEEVIRWAGERRSTVIWIEPSTNVVTENFIPRVLDWLRTRLSAVFLRHWDQPDSNLTSEAVYLHPMKPDHYTPRVHLSLIHLKASDQ